MRNRVLAASTLALAWAAPAGAQNLSAAVIGAIYDVASPDALAKGSGGKQLSADVLRAADTLRRQNLLTASRISTPHQTGLLDRWGRALLMGPRAPEFAREIGAVRDAALGGNLENQHAAISTLYKKAGRNPPTADALKTLDKQIDSALGEEPEESIRQTIAKPYSTVEITDAKRAGQVSVEVTQNDAGGKPLRTVFRGEEQTQPTPDGKDLQTSIVPTGTCTMNEQQSAEQRGRLNGSWKDGAGHEWTISGDGGTINAVQKYANGHTLGYSGTYKLGKAVAFHGFVSVDDIGDDLPSGVRSQLVGWSPKLGFTIRLDQCGTAEIKGTWASQLVTYGGIDQAVKRVHDPYDIPLVLTRGMKVAQGGRNPEEGP